MVYDSDINAKNIVYDGLGKLLLTARVLYAPVFQKVKPVAKVHRLIEVVQRTQDAHALLTRKFHRLLHYQLLVGYIEVPGGLVEHEKPRLLGKGPGDGHLLPLSARQAGSVPVRKVFQVHFGDYPLRHGLILFPGPESEAGDAPHEHGLKDGQLSKSYVLRDIGGQSGPLPSGHPQQIAAVKAHRACRGSEQPENIFEQGRLPAAVSPEQHAYFPGSQLQVHAPQNGAGARHMKTTVPLSQASATRLPEKIMAAKNGAPSRVVIAPTGSAEPPPILRESVSAISRRRLPLSMDAGVE